MEEEKKIEQFNKYSKRLNLAKIIMWALALLMVIGIALLFWTISKGDLPTFKQLENPEYDLASVIYDANNVPYGKYYVENREPIKYEDLSPHVVNALISTEDERFFSHSGIDVMALVRVAIKTVIFRQKSSGGGSTISQQLAKLLFERPSMRGMGKLKRTKTLISTKFKEWITAIKLEKKYTKEEIIAMYLNKFEFINGAHGIEAAAQTYFSKNQNKLNPDEAAILIGMLQNPSLYNPKRFPKKTQDRRNVVLNQMYKSDHISRSQLDSLSKKEILMEHFERKTQSEGPAPYFRSELTKWLRKLFVEEDITKSDGSSYNIYTDGLKIYTTIDLNYQRNAEEALKEHMQWNQERYWRTWKRKDPWTFEADDFQKEIRANMLERRVKSSDRYLKLRTRYLDEAIAKIRKKNADLPLSDNVIKSLSRIIDGKTSMEEEIEAGKIKVIYKSAYSKLLKSENWTELYLKWIELVKEYDKRFDTAVRMKIFDYENGEVDTLMTPLDSVRYHAMHLQGSLLSVDPATGYIKAWVGGINHKYFKYDHVNSRRAVGSTIKPFVYTTAISLQGISPCQTFDDIQYTIAPGDASFNLLEEWTPANANGEFTNNKYNLYQGLLYSKNSITVRLVKEMGNVRVIKELLRNAGIDTELKLHNGQIAVPELPSICLGAVDLPLMAMVGAYTTFSNNGNYTEPIFVTRIEDKNGRIIYTGIPDRKTAINPLYNAVMVDMLQNNVGGKYGMGLKSKVGGKTGTTNDYTDGWFMGITPKLVTGIWTGGDDKWIRFLTLDDGQGYVMARPIFEKYMRRLEKDSAAVYDATANFVDPPSGFFDLIDCAKFKSMSPEDEQSAILKSREQRDEFEEEFDDEEFDDTEYDDEEIDEESDDDLEEEFDDEEFDDDGN
ncbi:MAG: transglycosylase domain-containing protein [Saprospiraceae bacterium]